MKEMPVQYAHQERVVALSICKNADDWGLCGSVHYMGAGTFSEKGGQKSNLCGSANFFTLPSLLYSLPTLYLMFRVFKNVIVAHPNH